MRLSFVLIAVSALTACGDPLARVERISDVELAEEPVAQALPSQEELAREGGFFSRILRRDPDGSEVDAAVASAGQALGAEVETPDDATAAVVPEVAVDAPVDPDAAVVADRDADTAVAAEKPARRSGLLGWLKPEPEAETDAAAPSDPAGDAAIAEIAVIEPLPEPEAAPEDTESGSPAAYAAPVLVEPLKRRGLFGLGRASNTESAADTRTASVAPDPVSDLPVARMEPEKRRGLLGGNGRSDARKGVDASDVPYGTVLAYGEVARVCEAQGRPMGRKLDKAPARGKGYALYDSNPDSAGQRTFYVTGFSDGCPRQFTAALALFGAPSMHEQLRYGRPGSEYPYSSTDKAYEKVKSSVCGVGKRKPCGSKISQLERNTVFISTYERFEGNARWADILIHDGVVLAAAIKTP